MFKLKKFIYYKYTIILIINILWCSVIYLFSKKNKLKKIDNNFERLGNNNEIKNNLEGCKILI